MCKQDCWAWVNVSQNGECHQEQITCPLNRPNHRQALYNYHWQGSTHTNTNIGELYLRSYKNVIPITPDDIKEGGGVDAGVLSTNCGSCYYKSWMIPVSGQDSDKLAEKFVKKGPMKIQDKANRAFEMMQRMNLGGVGGV